jgi:hypothetical protein
VDQLWIFVPGNHGEEEETVRNRILRSKRDHMVSWLAVVSATYFESAVSPAGYLAAPVVREGGGGA